MNAAIATQRLQTTANAAYVLRLAASTADIHAAQELRFNVFNLEMNEGLAESFATRRDEDPFDAVCDHLLVVHRATGTIAGTYRLQTGEVAARNLGYYSEQEFDFSPFESIRSELVELGRACVDRAHRNLIVLGLLWKGIADYATQRGARYLIGCSSIASQNEAAGAMVYSNLMRRNLVPAELQTRPLPHCECSLNELTDDAPAVPKLLRAYLSLGAKICGPPAIDRQFGSIDFLTLIDLQTLPAQAKARLFGQ